MQLKKFPWPENKRCALSLTFDDSLISQINNGFPLFEKHNVKVTFYISPNHLKQRHVNWKEVMQNGHEIGNHTMTHPCTINFPFSRNNALENYTLEQIEEDINNANKFILKTLGISPNSFAYPCGQKFIGRGPNTKSYVPIIAKKFLTGRGFLDESPNDPWLCDFSQLLGMECDGKSFEELKTLLVSCFSQDEVVSHSRIFFVSIRL